MVGRVWTRLVLGLTAGGSLAGIYSVAVGAWDAWSLLLNGFEGAWSDARRIHRLCHGVDRENFPTFLAEHEFRYNHRDGHLLTILFDGLYRPRLIKGLAPRKIPGHQK